MDRYAVIGHPISHSKSPWIHQRFAAQLGEALEYSLLASEVDAFEETVQQFFSQGGLGLNVTLPFKERAFQLADELSERAEAAGAVNTLILHKSGKLGGDNTDGKGLVTDLQNSGFSIEGKRILILGAGGAVRGVLQPLFTAGAASIDIANRTATKAEALAAAFLKYGEMAGGGYDMLDADAAPYDLIINGTSASLEGQLPPLQANLLSENSMVYDMMYGAEPTVFERWGLDNGVIAGNGLGMLVEQAAESFYLWRNLRPDTQPVLSELRQSLK